MRATEMGSAVAVLAGAGFLAAGCGGSGGDSGERVTSIESVPTTPRSAAAKPGRTQKPGASSESQRKRQGTLPKGTDLRGAAGRVLSALPPDKRAGLVTRAARHLLSSYGFRNASVSSSRGGTAVRAVLTPRESCNGTASTEDHFRDHLRKMLPFVRSTSISVGSTGQSLSRYVAGNCRSLEPPAGRGTVVLTRDGSGPSKTPSFTVRSRRWAVEYVNNSPGFFQVLVLKGSQPTGDVVSVLKRGAGRKVMSGSGRFRLQIVGTGEWTVRVRDGS